MFRLKNRENSPGNDDDHYFGDDIQPTEFILEANLNWPEENIVKYICRHRKKGGLIDLQKVEWYLQTQQDYLKHYDWHRYVLLNHQSRKRVRDKLFSSLVRSQNLLFLEARILRNTLFWLIDDEYSLEKAKELIKELISEYEQSEPVSEG